VCCLTCLIDTHKMDERCFGGIWRLEYETNHQDVGLAYERWSNENMTFDIEFHLVNFTNWLQSMNSWLVVAGWLGFSMSRWKQPWDVCWRLLLEMEMGFHLDLFSVLICVCVVVCFFTINVLATRVIYSTSLYVSCSIANVFPIKFYLSLLQGVPIPSYGM